MRVIWLALVAALLAGCGGGGGSAAGTATQPGSVSVEFDTQAVNAAGVLYAVEFTLHLPAGVTVQADAGTGEVPASALHAADGAALAGARYLPANSSTQGSVTVNIVDPGGFGVGALATLNCLVAPGITLNGTAFILDGFTAKDASGALLPGITPHFTLRTQ
jgi:hypothetical protein